MTDDDDGGDHSGGERHYGVMIGITARGHVTPGRGSGGQGTRGYMGLHLPSYGPLHACVEYS